MKTLLFAMAVVSMASACTKEETKANNTMSTKENKEFMRPEEEFTREFEPYDGGKKAECTVKGNSCKVKFDINERMYEEMSILDGFIAGGDGNAYFNTADWEILFSEVANQQGLLSDIRNNRVRIYKMLNNNTNNAMYCLSIAQSQSSVTATNIVMGWNF